MDKAVFTIKNNSKYCSKYNTSNSIRIYYVSESGLLSNTINTIQYKQF